MKKRNRITIGLLFSVSVTYFLISSIDLKSTVSELTGFNAILLFLMLINYLLAMLLRASRWQSLLNQKLKIPFMAAFKYLCIGYMFNNILPAKGGELIRAEYLKQNGLSDRSFAYGTIFVERILDVVVVLLFFLLSVLFSETVQEAFLQNRVVAFFLISFVLIAIFFVFKPGYLKGIVKIFPGRVQAKLTEFLLEFSSAFKLVTEWRSFVKLFSFSLVIWGLTLLSSYIVIGGLSVTVPYSCRCNRITFAIWSPCRKGLGFCYYFSCYGFYSKHDYWNLFCNFWKK